MNAITQNLTNNLTDYNGLLQTYMNLVGSVASVLGCFLFLYVQKAFDWSTKTMLQISTVFTLFMPVWGCISISSYVVGFRSVTELWIYQAWFGIFTAPFYAYSQTLM